MGPDQAVDYTPCPVRPPAAALHQWDEIPLETVTEMVARKAVVTPTTRVTQMYVKQGALVPVHRHGTEQWIYVLQGALRVRVEGSLHTVREGEMLQLAAHAPHECEALDDTFLIEWRGSGTLESDRVKGA